MDSYTPLHISKFAASSDVPLPIDDSFEKNLEKKNSFSQVIFYSSLVAVFISGVFFTRYLFRINTPDQAIGAEQAASQVTESSLTFGVIPEKAPYMYIENGEPAGFDRAVAETIASQLSAKPEFQIYTQDEAFRALAEGNLDMIISAISISQEYKSDYLFSEPYTQQGEEEFFAIVFNKSDHALRNEVDEVILKLRDSGVLENLENRFLR